MLIWNLWTQLFITQLQELFIINLFNSVADTPAFSVKEQNVPVTICVMLLNQSIIPHSTWSIPRFTIDLHCWWPNSMFQIPENLSASRNLQYQKCVGGGRTSYQDRLERTKARWRFNLRLSPAFYLGKRLLKRQNARVKETFHVEKRQKKGRRFNLDVPAYEVLSSRVFNRLTSSAASSSNTCNSKKINLMTCKLIKPLLLRLLVLLRVLLGSLPTKDLPSPVLMGNDLLSSLNHHF